MAQTNRSNNNFTFRAKLPQYLRVTALVAIAAIVGIIVVAFYRERNKQTFHLRSEHTQLSNEVVAEVTGYERLETDGETPKYLVKASAARTFSDNHQELEDVFIQTYDQSGNASDKMSADKGLYIPEENKNFTAYLSGRVEIETRDALKVKTSHIIYSKQNETAEADEPVEFERGSVRGSSRAALLKVAEKRIELDREVEIDVSSSPVAGQEAIKEGTLSAVWAAYDHGGQTIELKGNVQALVQRINNQGAVQTITGSSDRALASLISQESEKPRLSQLELFDNVSLKSAAAGGDAASINANYIRYDKADDRFDLNREVYIVTTQRDTPAEARADGATYWQSDGKIMMVGRVELSQGINYAKGDALTAMLNADRKLKSCSIRGNSFVRQSAPERTIQVSASETNALFSDSGLLQAANGRGGVLAEIVPNSSAEYSKVAMTTPGSIKLGFKGEGALDQMRTDERTSIQLNVPDNNPDSANKRLTADTVLASFDDSGKNIRKAEAAGNAELLVEPIKPSPQNYRTNVYAPRFDCEFFPSGNNAKSCQGGRKTKTVRTPAVDSAGRSEQTLIADQLTVTFDIRTKDVERMDAVGSAKFTEADRSATASSMVFTQGDQIVRLRGSESAVWDSSARIRADEIDWDIESQRSSFRGGVSTTYYSRGQMNNAAPFGSSDKPVFVTSDSAEFDHQAHVGVYLGNARGWQENNYVRADRFTIKEPEGLFLADGNVQSLLYDVKQKRKNGETLVPVYASASAMTYSRDSHLLSYRANVDIRQGTDRIVTNSADVFLDEKNEVTKTVAANGVTITQPGRRASGNWAQYTTDDDVAVLRGDPARVEDSENGTSQGTQITVYLRENRVIGESKTAQGSGRLRSVYKVKNSQ